MASNEKPKLFADQPIHIILSSLAGSTTVMAELLCEDEGLKKLIRNKATEQECLDYINESY